MVLSKEIQRVILICLSFILLPQPEVQGMTVIAGKSREDSRADPHEENARHYVGGIPTPRLNFKNLDIFQHILDAQKNEETCGHPLLISERLTQEKIIESNIMQAPFFFPAHSLEAIERAYQAEQEELAKKDQDSDITHHTLYPSKEIIAYEQSNQFAAMNELQSIYTKLICEPLTKHGIPLNCNVPSDAACITLKNDEKAIIPLEVKERGRDNLLSSS